MFQHAECDQCPSTPFLFGIVEERYALEQGKLALVQKGQL